MVTRRPVGEPPPDDAYSRVTEPERFLPVAAEADRLVDELVRTYDVVTSPVALVWTRRAVRLEPVSGAPLVVGVTDFPGVLLLAGVWQAEVRLPSCGCDACDDDPDLLVEHLQHLIGAVVGGRFTERLDRSGHEAGFDFTDGGESSKRPLSRQDRRELEALAPRGERRWSPWPLRPLAVRPTLDP